MQQHLKICVLAGALAIGAAVVSAPVQAAPVAGLSAIPGSSAQASVLVDKAGWRRWRAHRNWWWRWRR
jgi:hypothetical protein